MWNTKKVPAQWGCNWMLQCRILHFYSEISYYLHVFVIELGYTLDRDLPTYVDAYFSHSCTEQLTLQNSFQDLCTLSLSDGAVLICSLLFWSNVIRHLCGGWTIIRYRNPSSKELIRALSEFTLIVNRCLNFFQCFAFCFWYYYCHK